MNKLTEFYCVHITGSIATLIQERNAKLYLFRFRILTIEISPLCRIILLKIKRILLKNKMRESCFFSLLYCPRYQSLVILEKFYNWFNYLLRRNSLTSPFFFFLICIFLQRVSYFCTDLHQYFNDLLCFAQLLRLSGRCRPKDSIDKLRISRKSLFK